MTAVAQVSNLIDDRSNINPDCSGMDINVVMATTSPILPARGHDAVERSVVTKHQF